MLAGQVYLIAGDESFLRDKAIEKIKRDLSKKTSHLVFYSNDKEIKEALDACRSMDMLADNLLVIFKGFENISSQDKSILNKYIQNPNPNACLAIEASTRYLKGKPPYDKLPKFKVIECNRHYLWDNPARIRYLNGWINRLVKEKDKAIESQAIESLIAKSGNNLKNISDAIEKLSLYVGEEKVIDLRHVQELIGFDAEYTAYNLIDEIFKKNTKESLRIASKVLSKKEDYFKLIGFISFQLTRIYKAKNLLLNKIPRQEILNQLRIKNWQADKFMRQAETFNTRTVNEAIDLLAQTDLNFKTLPGDYKNNFDTLIVKLCALK